MGNYLVNGLIAPGNSGGIYGIWLQLNYMPRGQQIPESLKKRQTLTDAGKMHNLNEWKTNIQYWENFIW